MNKRGQVSAYVLIGVVIVFIIGSLAYTQQLRSGATLTQSLTYPPRIQEVRDVVDSCVESTVHEGLMVLGLQGGYYQLPSRTSVNTALTSFAYWYKNGQAVVPSLDDIQRELNLYVKESVGGCAKVEQFQGLQINEGEISANTVIQEDTVFVRVEYPLVIQVGDQTTEVREAYTTNVQARVMKVYESARGVIENTVKNPDHIGVTYLAETGLDMEVTPIDATTLLYVFVDKESDVNGLPFQFIIGVEA